MKTSWIIYKNLSFVLIYWIEGVIAYWENCTILHFIQYCDIFFDIIPSLTDILNNEIVYGIIILVTVRSFNGCYIIGEGSYKYI